MKRSNASVDGKKQTNASHSMVILNQPVWLWVRSSLPLILVILTLLGATPDAAAQGTGLSADQAFTTVAEAIEERLRSLATSGTINSIGWQLFSFFIVANLVWLLLKNFATGSGIMGMITDLVPLAVLGAVVVGFLSYGMAAAIESSMAVLGGLITGEESTTLASLMVRSAGTALETIRSLWDISPTTGSSSTSGLAWVAEILLGIPAVMLAIIATIVGVFLVVMALAIYLAHLVMSQVGIYIALILAPFFVPFLLFKPASFLFDGWLRFFLGAALLKIVGLLLLQVTNVIMETALQVSRTTIEAGLTGLDAFVFDMTKYVIIILLAGIGALLMQSASSISSGLISGQGGGASFGGWSGLVNRSSAVRMLTGGMGAGGSGGGKAGQTSHALSGVSNMMPNFAKPVTSGAGKVISKAGGSMLAATDRRAARSGDAVGGERNIGRDTSRMSAASQQAYVRSMERANAATSRRETSGTFYGPPSPRYTVSKPTSSTTSSRQTTKRF